jgi:NADPH-dependent glutamate synthase beta subunit-like oxidoreductase
LDWDIAGILNLGIQYHTDMRLGVDFNLKHLIDEGYEAIFLGVGAWQDYALGVIGEDLKGCYTGIDFLSRIGNGEAIPIGQRAAVIGGGNTAIDCVRSLRRMGSGETFLVYRRTRNEMPANAAEIEAAEQEGIKFIFLASPLKVLGDGDDQVSDLEYLKMELGDPDESGRRRPLPIKGSETLLHVDMLITAIGQKPDTTFSNNGGRLNDLKFTRWGTLDVNPEILQTNIPYVFTAGDAATGPSLVVEAIGGGRRAARAIHLYLTRHNVIPVQKSLYKKRIPESIFDHVDGVKPKPRVKMPELPVEQRLKSFVEVDQVISETEALSEAGRCLDCCRICYNKEAA